VISAPAAKAFSPAPVKITTLTASSFSALLKKSVRASLTVVFKALYFAGRFIVMVAIPSATS
jgi:hypothetical protein